MSGFLYRLGRASAGHPWRVIAAWIVVAVSVLMLNSSVGGESDETFRLPGADSQRAADALAARFPEQTLFTSNVVFHAPGGLTSPEATTAIHAAVERLARGAHVISVTDPYDPRGPTISKDDTTGMATVGFDVEQVTPAMYDEAQQATQVARDAGLQVEYDGSLGYASAPAGPRR